MHECGLADGHDPVAALPAGLNLRNRGFHPSQGKEVFHPGKKMTRRMKDQGLRISFLRRRTTGLEVDEMGL